MKWRRTPLLIDRKSVNLPSSAHGASCQSFELRVKHSKCGKITKSNQKELLNHNSQQQKIKRSNSIFSFFLFAIFSFRPDNSDHIIDVNRNQINPFEYDQVNIICPNYSKGTRSDQAETYIIYNVSLLFLSFSLC